MAFATDHAARPGLVSRLLAFRDLLAQRRAAGRAYAQTHDELQALTDRELADLGINRGMIRDIAARAAQQA